MGKTGQGLLRGAAGGARNSRLGPGSWSRGRGFGPRLRLRAGRPGAGWRLSVLSSCASARPRLARARLSLSRALRSDLSKEKAAGSGVWFWNSRPGRRRETRESGQLRERGAQVRGRCSPGVGGSERWPSARRSGADGGDMGWARLRGVPEDAFLGLRASAPTAPELEPRSPLATYSSFSRP